MTVSGTGSATQGPITGLIDNNTFYDASYADGYTIAIAEWYRYPVTTSFDYSGGHAWTGRVLGWGTSDFIFIEDNLFENVGQYTRHYVAAFAGGRYVFRYNTTDTKRSGVGNTDQVDAHGWCHAGIGQGTRGGEIYRNSFGGTETGREVIIRGGAWVVYDNVFSRSPQMKLFDVPCRFE